MTSNSNPVSKRLKTESSSENGNSSNLNEMDGSASGGSSEETNSDDGVCTFANIFTDDILPDIFDNLKILTSKDLLTFRLVNRCWRDAATSVLLNHNLCTITLHFNKIEIDNNGDVLGWTELGQTYGPHPRGNLKIPPDDYYYFHYYKCKNFMSDLNFLISTSPKFPCNSFRFDQMALFGFGTLTPLTELNDANGNQQDLFLLFDLHGKNIKKIWLGGEISREALLSLLYVYTPHLSCLDLGNYSFTDEDEDDNENPSYITLPFELKIKEIVWGYEVDVDDNRDLEKELIRCCPNLSSVRAANMTALGILLDMEKSHLIQELELNFMNYTQNDVLTVLHFSKLLADNILKAKDYVPRSKLKKLRVMFFSKSCEKYSILVKALSIILSATKDSLEYLEFFPSSESESLVNLFIPPLPRLESLSLSDEGKSYNNKMYFRGDVIGEGMRAGEIAADETVDDVNALASQNNQGNSNIPAEHFPRLRKVKLSTCDTKYIPHKLMGFFSIENLGPSSSVTATPSDILVSVTTLTWETQSEQSSYENINMSKLFPNIVYLKILSWEPGHVPNWVWIFPKLERCEITGLPQNQLDTVKIVDSFFTGFSQEFCAAFAGDDALTQFDVKRTRPYIGNCKNLKELKIRFNTKLTSKFASKLTAVYGFQDVIPRTKIWFCFLACRVSEEEVKESTQYLDSVAAYVEIKRLDSY